MPKLESPCPTCYYSDKKGQLWLSGKDYLECPDCEGTGIFILYEQRVQPKRHILVPGLKNGSLLNG